MKKLIALLAVCGFALAFVSCGPKQEAAESVEEAPAMETVEPVEEMPMTDTTAVMDTVVVQ